MKNLLLNKEIPSSADYVVVAYDSKEGKVSFKGAVTMYTVTFKDWDNSVISSSKYVEGSAITVPSNPTREGYEFTKWTPTISPTAVADATYVAEYKEVPTFEYVDLGLPSGLKWAKCNIGAKNEYDAGLYFQWGDTVGRTADEVASKPCTWSTTPFNNGSNSYDPSYLASVSGDVCLNGVLAKEYDVASVNMGGSWRMPTTADTKELVDNTTSTWYASGNTEFNGVAGRKFTSKSDPTKYIFIPAVGFAENKSMFSVGYCALVWSSSLIPSAPDRVYSLFFVSDYVGTTYERSRFYGYSVRGVLE